MALTQPDLLSKSCYLCLRKTCCLRTGLFPLCSPWSSITICCLMNHNGFFSDLPALDLTYSTARIYTFQNVNQSMPCLCLTPVGGFLWHSEPSPNSFPGPPRVPKSGPGHCFTLIPLHAPLWSLCSRRARLLLCNLSTAPYLIYLQIPSQGLKPSRYKSIFID